MPLELSLPFLALSGAATWAVGHSLCASGGQPPFITARLLADGPGRSYLRAVCSARPCSSPAPRGSATR